MSLLPKLLIKNDIIKHGNFTLKSGVKSDIYIDCKQCISHPVIYNEIIEKMEDIAKNLNFDVIAGVPYGASVFASMLAYKLNYPMIFIRKEAKEHGTQQLIEGKYNNGTKCLLIEDVITSGKSLNETIKILNAQNIIVIDCIVIMDRRENANNATLCRINSLMTIDQMRDSSEKRKREFEQQLPQKKQKCEGKIEYFDLSAKIKSLGKNCDDFHMDLCIYNAPCIASKSIKDLELLDKSNINLAMTKTHTNLPRYGCNEPVYYDDGNIAINCVGLKSAGIDKYIDYYENNENNENKSYNTSYNKSYGMSVNTVSALKKIINKSKNNPPKLVEMNLFCPNVDGEISDDNVVLKILKLLDEIRDIEVPFLLGLKLPYLRKDEIQRIAKILNVQNVIDFIICVNAPSGIVIKNDGAVISEKIGGISGQSIKPLALGNVYQFSQLTNVPIIGVGGISTGQDVYDYILCGATAVQIGTQLIREGVQCFSRIEQELMDVMWNNGYTELNEFRGKL